MINIRVTLPKGVYDNFLVRADEFNVSKTSLVNYALSKLNDDPTGEELDNFLEESFLIMVSKNSDCAITFRLDMEHMYPSLYQRVTDARIKPTQFIRGVVYLISEGKLVSPKQES